MSMIMSQVLKFVDSPKPKDCKNILRTKNWLKNSF